ncbi:hypothetical protein A3B02_02170 [Candidatus Roizmanbacteria bacterium RIFCSPLOWO2_01_FULL_42_14]|uniref:Fido domain-containing protein n=4 Tax=Candidatus Roizmaniibacteriota TaxID=1752723 RepID=A0A1F7K237_9BACT|nr:MAG: hypothetical protein A3D08_02550 [Candidatus Roizmanbacteria bacterium RIFCSPHIGHO2_02_FULL_43_11]OGK37789.1 MAG: hypothetical protein A3F32_01555 [Candidatus Roizmanbacteria bacterium RIFCSPHIGHO2_12_FULL_42_10]OGK51930.1 MAG: hypothetical protein A3B02_02170 [Candidatus Roizmanbacteria bacterium RIFCSPLOWO2_01_FULL_42_14]OGK61943.1 MAG: hypothetical protein A3I56_02340 [Candidatus Roizmanbacteria bacterium RIFCSPLOWO2_02_FULL_43_10]
MNDIQFLSIEEVVIIHEKMIAIGGGASDILNIDLLHASVERPRAMFGGTYVYISIFDMAAALIQSLVKNHPFLDGNKRTAFFSGMRFLEINGHQLSANREEIVTFIVSIDQDNLSIEKISQWLSQRAHKQA